MKNYLKGIEHSDIKVEINNITIPQEKKAFFAPTRSIMTLLKSFATAMTLNVL